MVDTGEKIKSAKRLQKTLQRLIEIDENEIKKVTSAKWLFVGECKIKFERQMFLWLSYNYTHNHDVLCFIWTL